MGTAAGCTGVAELLTPPPTHPPTLTSPPPHTRMRGRAHTPPHSRSHPPTPPPFAPTRTPPHSRSHLHHTRMRRRGHAAPQLPCHAAHPHPNGPPCCACCVQEEVPAAEQRAWVAALLQPLVAQIDTNLQVAADEARLLQPGNVPPALLIQVGVPWWCGGVGRRFGCSACCGGDRYLLLLLPLSLLLLHSLDLLGGVGAPHFLTWAPVPPPPYSKRWRR